MRARIALSVIVAAASLGVFFFAVPLETSEIGPRGRYTGGRVDMHTHLHPRRTAEALVYMDRYGIDVAIDLSTLPPSPMLRALIARETKTNGRILTFAGFAWPELLGGEGFGERMAKAVYRAKKMGARGLKIPKALGLSLPDPDGGHLKVDDERLAPAFDAAGKYGLPVAIHVGDPVAFWDKVDEDNPRFEKNIAVLGLQLADFRHNLPEDVAAAQARLFARYRQGRIDPFVSLTLPLERFSEALDRIREGRVMGKVVLNVAGC